MRNHRIIYAGLPDIALFDHDIVKLYVSLLQRTKFVSGEVNIVLLSAAVVIIAMIRFYIKDYKKRTYFIRRYPLKAAFEDTNNKKKVRE